jgi:hypothetical protein
VSYESDGPKAELQKAESKLDSMTLNFKSIAESLEFVRGTLLEIGLTTEIVVAGGVLMTQSMDGQIDQYLKEIFQLRTALTNYRNAL